MKASERHQLKHDKYADTIMGLWARAIHYQREVIAILIAAGIIILGTIYFVSQKSGKMETDLKLFAESQNIISQQAGEKIPDANAMENSISNLRKLYEARPNQTLGHMALLETANTYATLNNWPRATEVYQEALAAPRLSPELARMARGSLASALEQTGDYANALEHYKLLAEKQEKGMLAQYMLAQGRCLEKLDRIADAVAAYEQAAAAAPGNIFSRWAKERIGTISGSLASVKAPQNRTS